MKKKEIVQKYTASVSGNVEMLGANRNTADVVSYSKLMKTPAELPRCSNSSELSMGVILDVLMPKTGRPQY